MIIHNDNNSLPTLPNGDCTSTTVKKWVMDGQGRYKWSNSSYKRIGELGNLLQFLENPLPPLRNGQYIPRTPKNEAK
jgi:hypothetical protein